MAPSAAGTSAPTTPARYLILDDQQEVHILLIQWFGS